MSDIKPTEAEFRVVDLIWEAFEKAMAKKGITLIDAATCKPALALVVAYTTRVNGQDAATLAKRVEELESQQYEHCEECNGVLTMCGELSQFGDPTMDCEVCQLRSRAETAERELAEFHSGFRITVLEPIYEEKLATAQAENVKLGEERDKAIAEVASYARQDELLGTEFEGVDEVTEVLRLLKSEREALRIAVAELICQDPASYDVDEAIKPYIAHAKAMREVVEAAKVTVKLDCRGEPVAIGTTTELRTLCNAIAVIEGGVYRHNCEKWVRCDPETGNPLPEPNANNLEGGAA